MKTGIKAFIIILLTVFFSTKIFAQNRMDVRAKEGEKMFVIVNYVKDEAKADYETFMKDVFFKVLTESENSVTKQADLSTRWLKPAMQNKDKSWTYIFLMDPVVEKADYDIENLFKEKYSESEAANLMKKYSGFMAKPYDFHFMIQSDK